ncbi:MAG: folylpolyglutamate synthase/dihydrofolate synthase family protein [Pseudomonadota bacterium]
MTSRLRPWLERISLIHPATMDLGLERIGEVYRRMGSPRPPRVITVAGTNGKGSSCAILTAVLRHAGHRVGTYTSPHLFRFNERIALNAEPAEDDRIVAAFEAVEAAREDTLLTYFEYATLAALWLFQAEQVDVAVLEVGLGGRLDAVNLVDADGAVISSIGFDHMHWLGNTLDDIAREKAGILRRDRPAVCSQTDAPAGLHRAAATVGAHWRIAGRDFRARRQAQTWSFHSDTITLDGLPLPSLPGAHQLANAAGCLEVLRLLDLLPSTAVLGQALREIKLKGRLWQVSSRPDIVLDVCHNPASARVVRQWLEAEPVKGQQWLILGMLKDKKPQEVVEALSPAVDRWVLCGLPTRRGLSARALRSRIRVPGLRTTLAEDPREALARVIPQLAPEDRLLIAGSFVTVEWAGQRWVNNPPLKASV